MEMIRGLHLRALFGISVFALCTFLAPSALALPNADIAFVGQIPNPTDFATANATFGNHLATVESIVRGGDLFIRYRNGHVKNITRSAGYGKSGFQGASSIAVRDPAVSWDGSKIIFSMVVGAPTEQYVYGSYVWQLYEATGLAESETPVIVKVPRQPEGYNNVSPVYGTDDTIFFTTDRPRNGAEHLYPQRDEYESQPTNTGLWNLNPLTGELRLLDHAPSGAFEPILDSFGRIIYSRWDHMQRDQQSDDTDANGGFNFSTEAADAARSADKTELFPEPRVRELIEDPRVEPHDFNHFFPWQINEDGTGHETLNHIGRHELHGYFDRSFNDDDALLEHYGDNLSSEQREIENFLHISEDPLHPGRYFAIDAPEFRTHAAGQVIALEGAPQRTGDHMPLTYITTRSTASLDPDNLAADHTGFYRDPLPLSDGSLVVVHTPQKIEDENIGSSTNPQSRYSFRLKTIKKVGEFWEPDQLLTGGITANITYFTPDEAATYAGPLWELQPVEIAPRTKPVRSSPELEAPESAVFLERGVLVDDLKASLAERNLALIVMRNVTTRDSADKQQPFNLRVPGGVQSSIGGEKLYSISHLQLFQGDQVRGYGGIAEPERGRRVIAQLLHDGMDGNPALQDAPPSSVQIAADGSIAAIVPARRALTWHLTDPDGTSVVRERYWLTFQPGEIRVCASCHGVNSRDQLDRTAPTNEPEALRSLLEYLKTHPLPEGERPPTPVTRLKSYSLSVRGAKTGELRAQRRGIVTVRVNNATAPEDISIGLTVGGTRCSRAIASVTTDEHGVGRVRGMAPLARRRGVPLLFSALRSGSTVTTSSARLVNPRARYSALDTLAPSEARRLCSAFRRFTG